MSDIRSKPRYYKDKGADCLALDRPWFVERLDWPGGPSIAAFTVETDADEYCSAKNAVNNGWPNRRDPSKADRRGYVQDRRDWSCSCGRGVNDPCPGCGRNQAEVPASNFICSGCGKQMRETEVIRGAYPVLCMRCTFPDNFPKKPRTLDDLTDAEVVDLFLKLEPSPGIGKQLKNGDFAAWFDPDSDGTWFSTNPYAAMRAALKSAGIEVPNA